jgi:hypothetical protein
MVELNLNCSIIIKKNDFNVYDILLNNLSNGDEILTNEINNQLKLSTKILNDCNIKVKCKNNSEYNNSIINLKAELNDKYNSSIEQLKIDYEAQLKLCKNDLFNSELNFKSLKESYDTLYNDLKQNIEYNLIEQFKHKENLLQQQIIHDKNKFDQLIDIKSNAIKNDYEIKLNNLQNHNNSLKYTIEELNNKLSFTNHIDHKLSDFQHLISSSLNNINKHFNCNDSSQSGEIGEMFIYNYLSESLKLNDGSIQRVNGKNHACDLLLNFNNLKCCIESKNHSSPIRQDSINRFLNIDLLNSEYNSGIFISIKSDFVFSSSIKHFDIQIVHNKPIIFLSNFISKPSDIILAIKIIDFLLYQLTFDNANIQSYISFLNSHINILNQLISFNHSISNILADSNNKIKLAITDIEKLLNIKSSQFKFFCDICNAGFDKKVPFNKHVKSCKQI